jgi:universal stress protein A
MKAYQHVLAAVDLGANSATVLQRAAALARLNNSALSVLHVVNHIPAVDIDYLLPPMDDIENRLIENAGKRVQKLLEHEADAKDAAIIVISGLPRVEIVRTAEQKKVDLIVVGAHGRHGITGLLGSTTGRVLHRAMCDVLTVR